MLIHLSTWSFFSDSHHHIRELTRLQNSSTDKLCHPVIQSFMYIQSVFKMKKVNDSSCGVFFRLVFPLTVLRYLVILCWVTLAAYLSPLTLLPFYSQVASSLKLVSYWYAKLILLICFHSIATKKVFLRTGIPKLQSLILIFTRKFVQLVHCFLPIDRFSSRSPELRWIITLPRNILKQLVTSLMNENYVTKTSTAFTSCEDISGRNMEQGEVQLLKVLMLHN